MFYMMFYRQWGRIYTQWFALRCFNSSYVHNRIWNTAVNAALIKSEKFQNFGQLKDKNLLESRNGTRASKIIFSTLEICDIDSMQLFFCQLTFILLLSVFTCNVPQFNFLPVTYLNVTFTFCISLLYRVLTIILLFFEHCGAVKGNIYQVFVFGLYLQFFTF